MQSLTTQQLKSSYLFNNNYQTLGDNNEIITNQNNLSYNDTFDFKSKKIEVSDDQIIGTDNLNQIIIYDKLSFIKKNKLELKTFLKSGDSHSCVQNVYGLKCWGLNVYGAIDIPTEFSDIDLNILSLGADHTCGQTEFNTICWGAD